MMKIDDDKELKKMRFLFSLGRELEEVDLSVEELIMILSGDSRPANVNPAGTEVDGILKDDEELLGTPKDLKVKVDEKLPTATPSNKGGSISCNRVIHDNLRRTTMADGLTELEKDRIEMIFFEMINEDGTLKPAVEMHNMMMYRLGKNIDIKLVYSLRTCYNKYLLSKGQGKIKHKRYKLLSTLDKDGSVRKLIIDMLNDGVALRNIVRSVKKEYGIDISKDQVKYIRKTDTQVKKK